MSHTFGEEEIIFFPYGLLRMIPSYYGRSSAVYFFDRIYRINFCGSSPEELVISQGFKDSRVQGFSASGFLWLKSSHALILNEVEHFSKVSIPRELRHRRVLKVAVYIQGFRIQRFKGSGFRVHRGFRVKAELRTPRT
jgi:hypothetical protein